jgi:hypothetical protein
MDTPPPLDHTSVLPQLSNCLNSIKSLTETPVNPIPNPLDTQPEWKVLESVERLILWMHMWLRGFVGSSETVTTGIRCAVSAQRCLWHEINLAYQVGNCRRRHFGGCDGVAFVVRSYQRWCLKSMGV